ncbi:WecB/TagA/CpsF family glycosyltransferase [Sphaerisporangium sp. TRM90804]|uniref:WecB/TagA/CpsF family glycosyltransferase n=1 Tax=Sphaerisporangium sp. TRM90804 TaxID=3031113 RepID=UPI0024470E12|nr:WecB/TagA/CpsF family glycosyltransferase [Sphaerisporangium sp. TRM90804]MDH2428749.1 WecB/TagA/CpsF family glycosyltransferase [Sphaerisporangium sp. TRM90804]
MTSLIKLAARPSPKERQGGPRGVGRVRVAGVVVDALTEREVVAHVIAAAARGQGGHVVTPNVDICRTCARDPEVRAIVAGAELAVPDGMPLVWASRLLGTPVPERITGADLIWSLSEAAAAHGIPVYLLGGPPGVAVRAAEVLGERFPGLRVAGVMAPLYGFDTSADGVALVEEAVVAARPGLVFVGLGFPKQDRLITTLRAAVPGAWFVGCGAAIAFTAGSVRRAPEWMRRSGLEWLYRLACEPARLARRYLVDDLPFALRLLTICLLKRLTNAMLRRLGLGRRPMS